MLSAKKLPVRFGHKVFYVSEERALQYYALEYGESRTHEKMELLKQWGVWERRRAPVVQFPGVAATK